MVRRILAFLFAVSVCWAGCGDDDGEPFKYDLPFDPGGCGLPVYEWLPPSEVGEIISIEEAVDSPVSARGINALIANSIFHTFPEVSYGARMYYVRYRTQDKGQPVEATAMVGFPWNDGMDRTEFPMVMWLHGTTGWNGECAPSLLGVENRLPPLIFAGLGYVVAAPDYIGLDTGADFSQPPPVKHAYIGIEQTAIGSLDSLRAAQELAGEVDTDAVPTDRVAFWGASQGGHAAFACDLLAPFYTPEFEVVTSVAAVPATDLLGLTQYSMSGWNDTSGLVAMMTVAQNEWFEGTVSMADVLTDTDPNHFATALPEAMWVGCLAEDLTDLAQAPENLYTQAALDAVAAGSWDQWQPWGCYFTTNSIATTFIPRTRETPTLFVTGENDLLVYSPIEYADFDRLCSMGYKLMHLECGEADHGDAVIWSLAEQADWVNARMAGVPVTETELCQLKTPVRCSGQE